MKRRMVVISALMGLVAASVSAQDPAPAAAPAAAQKLPRGGPNRNEFRIGGFMLNGERSYEYLSSSGYAETGSIKGVEVLLRATGIGVYVRSLSGEFGNQPQVISADARLLLFPPPFTLFGGVGKRALSSTRNTLVYDVMIVGVSSTLNIGGTGWRTHISGNAVLSPDKSATGAAVAKQASTGLEGEAAVFYRFARAPFFFTLGYRTEVFTGKSTSGSGPTATTVESPEEVRGLRFGGGIQFGGR